MKELKEYFCDLLEQQTDRVVLILDSLDQLRDFGSKLRDWIPKNLPENVTMLLSCIPADEFVVGPELKVSNFRVCWTTFLKTIYTTVPISFRLYLLQFNHC